MATREEMLAEAYRRGLLDDNKKAAYEEAVRRGLIGKAPAPQEVDDKTGAGWRERYIIGSASDDKTRMERAKAIWGDNARMDDDGRVMFRNPETSRWTYVNPKGLDLGDLAGVGREAVSMAAGIPATVLALPSGLGALAAGSAASAAGGQAADMAAAKMARDIARERGNPVPEMQSPADAAKEAALETAFGMAGGAILGKAGKLVKGAFNPLDEGYVAAFRNAGVDIPTIGTGSGGKGAAMIENALSGMPTSAGAMTRASERAQKQLTESLVETANKVAGGTAAASETELGDIAKSAAKRSLESFRAQQKAWYDQFHKTWGNAPANLSNTEKTIWDLTYGRGLAPETAKAEYERLMGLLGNEAKDAAAGQMNMPTVAHLRTRIGNLRDSQSALQTAGVDKAPVDAIYGALTRDYEAAITNPVDLAAFRSHKAWENAQYAARDVLDPIFKAGDGDSAAIGKKLLSTNLSRDDVNMMRSVLDPADMDRITGGILRQTGTALSSEGTPYVSPTQLSKQLTPGRGQSYSGEAIEALYPNTGAGSVGQKVADLRTVGNALSNGARNANTSRTAQTQAAMHLIGQGSIGGMGGWFFGNPVAGAAAGLAVPWTLAKGTTNRTLIDFLAKPQTAASRMLFNSGALPYLGIEGGLLTRFEADK